MVDTFRGRLDIPAGDKPSEDVAGCFWVSEQKIAMAKVQTRRTRLNRYRVPDWVQQQVFLNPYPEKLMLLNHV
jgi:hypothetical protein